MHANGKQANAVTEENDETEPQAKITRLVYGKAQEINPIGRGQKIRERLHEKWKVIDGDKQNRRRKDHGETEKIGEGWASKLPLTDTAIKSPGKLR